MTLPHVQGDSGGRNEWVCTDLVVPVWTRFKVTFISIQSCEYKEQELAQKKGPDVNATI